MKNLYLFCFISVAHIATAQKFSVRGQVIDSVANPLPGATVMLLSMKDSSLVNFNVTNAQGSFEIKNVSSAPYILKVTFIGYRTYSGTVQPVDNGDVDLGRLTMYVAQTKLDEIVIAEKIPVVVKRDTIEFNAGAFKTAKNASVEELLKKLPGVEVDSDGNITAQGETVQRITVDGKDFFGGRDPKMATRNLPADAVSKVQVHDRKSDQALFTGIDDGQKQKAINLELKEEKKNAAFGNSSAGYGTNDRFQFKTNLNKFSKGKQFSFLGMANNVNDQGFSMDEYLNFTGGGSRLASGGGQVRIQLSDNNQNGVPLNFGNRANGLMKSYAAGLNFNNEFSKKTELNGSYFFNYLDHDRLQTTSRENFLRDSRFVYNENSAMSNTNLNHRLNASLDHKIDSSNSVRFTTTATYNETASSTRTTSDNRTTNGDILNQNDSHATADGSSTNVNSSLLYRHKFPRKGRTFSTNVQFGLSRSDRDGLLDATYSFQDQEDREVKQRNTQTTDNHSYGATASYTEPLGNRQYIEANYSFRRNINDVDRAVYDLFNDESAFNDSLSNKYSSDYVYHRAGMNFRINRKKFTATLGTGFQNTHLHGKLEIQGVTIDRSFRNVLPVAHFNYDFSNTKHLAFDYETAVQEPTIQQLQPVVDNRDQLNPYQGNPGLRPSYEQRWRLNFTTFDPGTFISFFAFVDVDYTTNAIVNSITNANFIRTTTPVNVSRALNKSANVAFSFPVNKIKSRFSLSGNFRDQRGVNVLDDVSYGVIQQSSGGNARFNYRYKEFIDLNLSAQLSHQETRFEFDQPDQTFLNQTYASEANFTIAKNYQLSGNADYLIYESTSTNFRQTITLINASLSRFFLKGNSGELKLSVHNLLDQALGIAQTTSVNYIERTTTNSLGRYFMVSFIYSLNRQLNPMGGTRRGGGQMIRVMRQ